MEEGVDEDVALLRDVEDRLHLNSDLGAVDSSKRHLAETDAEGA
jgi:hypothetical protein